MIKSFLNDFALLNDFSFNRQFFLISRFFLFIKGFDPTSFFGVAGCLDKPLALFAILKKKN